MKSHSVLGKREKLTKLFFVISAVKKLTCLHVDIRRYGGGMFISKMVRGSFSEEVTFKLIPSSERKPVSQDLE